MVAGWGHEGDPCLTPRFPHMPSSSGTETSPPSTRSTSTSAAAKSTVSSAGTAQVRRPPSPLLGLIRPSSGDVSVLGRRIRPGETSVFSRVGFLVETATAYPNLTVHENLDIQRRLTASPPRSVADSIALLRLDPYASRRAGSSHSATGSASRSPARPFGLVEQLGHCSPAGPPRQGTLLYLGGRPLLVLQLPDDADCFNVCGEAGFLSLWRKVRLGCWAESPNRGNRCRRGPICVAVAVVSPWSSRPSRAPQGRHGRSSKPAARSGRCSHDAAEPRH